MPGPKTPSRPNIFNYKGAAEYKSWLQRLASHSRQPVAVVVDLALIDYARKLGFPEPAPPRNPPRA